ncbi:MAG: SMC family ATPase [Clostridia bacterium]|nr:SMC family ATPase [Clostridia bacterium]
MKPLKVSMQAFGPYNNLQICDFADLKNSNIFLITGPTGSGKTSILDAICFSLYGQATGALRNFRDMRNTAAPKELDTLTAFEFSLGEKVYKFQRTVHLHQKRNGDVDEKVNGECYIKAGDDWQLITSGAEAVTKKATEILGFDKDQFSQVVVLPQGEFRKLLVASSKEKLSILQTLFSTGVWQKIIEEFSKKARALNDELEADLLVKKTMLNGVNCETVDELESKITESSDELKTSEQKLKVSAEALQKVQDKYNTAVSQNEKLAQLKSVCHDLDKLKAIADDVKTRRAEYERLCKIKDFYPVIQRHQADEQQLVKCKQESENAYAVLNAAQAELKAAYDEANKVETLKTEQSQLTERITQLNVLLPDCEKLEGLLPKLSETEQKLKGKSDELKQKNEKANEYVKRIENGENYVSELFEKSIKPLESMLEEQNKVVRMLEKFGLKTTAQKELLKLDAELKQAKTLLDAAQMELDASQVEAQRIKEILSHSKAYSLAAQLKEGEKCPVCGSTHHPQLAESPLTEVNQQAVDKIIEQCVKNVSDRKSAFDTVNAQLSLKQKELEALNTECDGFGVDEQSCTARKNELTLFIEQSNKAKIDYETYQNKIAEFKQLKQDILDAAKLLENEINLVTAQLSALKAQITEIRSRLPEDFDYKAAKDEARLKQKRLSDVTDEILKSEQRVAKAEKEHILAKTKAESAKRLLETTLKTVEKGRLDVAEKLSSLGIAEDVQISTLIKENAWFETESAYLSEYDSNISILTHKKAELEGQTEGTSMVDLTELEAELESKKQENSAVAQWVGQLRSQYTQLCDTKKTISKQSKQTAEKEVWFGKISRLHKFVSGANSFKTPINNFVLGLTLDDVVFSATRYLTKFSKGRYSLIRVDSSSGSGLHGLDIEVKDGHTGGVRKVSTLSGGEMFLASLSLALGLAEVVQSYSGGIMLDSIFIDEGFGSLDSDTLDCAMVALEQIRREGRTVGIISHVPELKERIGARIEISNTERGVRLEVKHLF